MSQTQSEVSDSSRCQACDRGRQTRRKRGAAPEHYNHCYAGHSAEQRNERKHNGSCAATTPELHAREILEAALPQACKPDNER